MTLPRSLRSTIVSILCGVEPDIEVENPPDAIISGHDPQLERAIRYVNDELAAHPPLKPAHPKHKVQ